MKSVNQLCREDLGKSFVACSEKYADFIGVLKLHQDGGLYLEDDFHNQLHLKPYHALSEYSRGINHLELLKKYMHCLDLYDGYPDDAIKYGLYKEMLTNEEAQELHRIWEELP